MILKVFFFSECDYIESMDITAYFVVAFFVLLNVNTLKVQSKLMLKTSIACSKKKAALCMSMISPKHPFSQSSRIFLH